VRNNGQDSVEGSIGEAGNRGRGAAVDPRTLGAGPAPRPKTLVQSIAVI